MPNKKSGQFDSHCIVCKIEDFLSPSYFSLLKERVLMEPKYQLVPHTSYLPSENHLISANEFDVGQFVCSILTPEQGIVNESLFRFLEPAMLQLYDKLPNYDFRGVVRAKANILTCRPDFPQEAYNEPHVDWDSSSVFSCLLYLDDADGDTVIFNEKFNEQGVQPNRFTELIRISPKPNTVVFFNSGHYHASCNPRKSNYRAVINIIFNAIMKSEVFHNAAS